MNRTEMKRIAQGALMDGIGNTLGYIWEQDHLLPEGWEDWPEERQNEFRAILRREADRAARVFGFERAWSN